MIQELLGGAALIGGERKISITGTILEGTTPSSCSSTPSLSPPSTTTAAATATSAANSSTSTSENLRCPRCDSTNTKFCYYNNYNLTQPRHFCKTCRRYWTKGGALRNVPIGGGCRKNKSTSSGSASVGKSSSSKIKTFASEIGRSGGFGSGFDSELATSSMSWASPQNSHLLALLRGDQNPNPSGLPSSISVKDEGAMIGIGTQVIAEPIVATGALNARILGLEPISQASPGSFGSPFWKNSQQLPAQQHTQNGFLVGADAQNSGLQELYQRLKSSTGYYTDNSPLVLSNVAASSTSSSSSTILDSSPVVGGELGYWNPVISWSDLPN